MSRAVIDRRFSELTVGDLHDILRLRVDVFVVEQECPYAEVDGRDPLPGTRHLWIAGADGSPDAYLRLLDEPAARRIGRVVVRPSARGEGLGRVLIEYVVAGYGGPWELEAQAHLARWYETMGFVVTGPEIDVDGIPHVPMRREPA